MKNDSDEIRLEIRAVLDEWRRKAINTLMVIFSVVGLAALLIQAFSDTLVNTSYLPATIVFGLCYIAFVFFAFNKSINIRLRGWALLFIIYLVGLISFARGGLSGDGRLLLFVLPYLAVLLIDLKAAYVMITLDIIAYVAFTTFAHTGLLAQWALPSLVEKPFAVWNWVIEGMYTLFTMGLTLPLMIIFLNFMTRAVERERHALHEVSEARSMLEIYNQNLEIKVAQRTSELEQAVHEAQEARESSEAANKAKSAFLATMSHEIRTPLNAIIGMTSLMQDTPLSMKQCEFTETIRTSGETLLAVINDILDFSKIEAGRMDLDHHPYHVHHCLDAVVNMMSTRAAEKALTLNCEIGENVPHTLVGDESHLRQILINLIGNAIKFTERGEVIIKLDAQPVEDQDESTEKEKRLYRLLFTVQDTGIGIPKDRVSLLFQPFSQVDASTTRRYSGTGLGLVISKRLVEMMGGEIWVESIEGQGTTFSFTILAEVTSITHQLTRTDGRINLTDKRILIIDGNAANRRILTKQMQAWNLTAWATGAPVEALKWLRSGESFQAALIDCDLPETNGTTLVSEIRQIQGINHLPLILITPPGQTAQVGNDGCMVLTKPLKASLLYNALFSVFAKDVESALRDENQRSAHFDPHMADRLPLRILIVEDNTINQNLISLMLDKMGYAADVAVNGLEALQILRRQKYDVVLMDVQMPEMDGLEATRQIRKEFEPDQQPWIIAMTAHALSGDREICIGAGMDDYISKPIHIENLVNSLNCCDQRLTKEYELRQSLPGETAAAQGFLALNSNIDSEPVIDQAELERLLETLGTRSSILLPAFITGFTQQAEEMIENLSHQIGYRKTGEVLRLAHTLKANSASFGACRLARSAGHLEMIARLNSLEGANELLDQIRREYQSAKVTLEELEQERF